MSIQFISFKQWHAAGEIAIAKEPDSIVSGLRVYQFLSSYDEVVLRNQFGVKSGPFTHIALDEKNAYVFDAVNNKHLISMGEYALRDA